MPDISLGTNDNNSVGEEENTGLVDAPAKSPLEQSASSGNQEQPNPVASSAMPDAAPQEMGSAPPPPAESPQDETASVPDTDKFLESILENNNSNTASPDLVPQEPTQPPAMNENPAGSEAGNVNVAVNENQAAPVENIAPPAPPVQEETSEIPVAPQAEGEAPKIKDDIRGLDTVMNGITPPNEPSKPISDNPVGAMQAQKSSGGSMKAILIIVLVIALGAAAYFAYNMLFAGQTEQTPLDSSSEIGLISPVADGSATVAMTNDDTRKQDLAQIHVALKSFFSATGKYPLAAERTPLNTANNILEKELVGAGYITAIPADPDQTKYYAYKSDGATFSLTAVLDSSSDPEAKLDGGLALYEINQDSVVTTSPNSVTTPDGVNGAGATDQTDTSVSSDSSLNPFYPAGTPTETTGLPTDGSTTQTTEVIL